jgi:hypothetical protein
MFRPHYYPLFLLLFLSGSFGPARVLAGDGPGPLWPLDLDSRYLTSNFMEYRSGRFHAGIDLKTRSQKGFPALAAEDGWILRVRATPFAYGRAVYLRGASGRTYVYAHLDRFNDVIRTRVLAARRESGRYRVRLSFQPGEIPVRRGEVLGLTGESGTNGPHLHFEVRDQKNRPINPFMAGFAVPDTLAPVILAIRAIPVTAVSRLAGTGGAVVLRPAAGASLAGEQPPLHLDGPAAFSARIEDVADIKGHKLEPWLIEVRLDGELVYRCTNNVYDFAENSLQRLEWLELPGIRDRWLHRRAANTLTGREGGLWFLGTDGSGLSPGVHHLEILAADQADNRVVAAFPVIVGTGAEADTTGSGGWAREPVSVALDDQKEPPGSYLAPFYHTLGEGGQDLELLYLDPGDDDPVHAAATLGRRSVELEEAQVTQAKRQGLQPLGPGLEFLAADWPIDSAVVVDLPGYTPSGPDSLAIDSDPAVRAYRWRSGKWASAGRVMEPARPDGPVRLPLGTPGFYALMRDSAGPVINVPGRTLAVYAAEPSTVPGITLSRWAVFAVGMVDNGSGIAPESITATIDGAPLIVEPDLPRRRVLVELPDDLPAGPHRLVLAVRDDAGHRAEAVVNLDCRP